MIARRPIAFSLIALCVAAAHARGGDLEPATTKGNVTIQLPKGWPASGGNERSVLSALAPAVDTDATGKFQASFTITQDAGTKVDGAAQQKVLAGQLTQYQVIEKPTTITAGTQQGVLFGGTFKRGATEFRTRQYMFPVNNQIYTITFTCLNSKWATYQPALEASVATLSFKH